MPSGACGGSFPANAMVHDAETSFVAPQRQPSRRACTMLLERRMNMQALAVVAGAVVLASCSSKAKSSPAETTAAKVDRPRAEALDRLEESARVLSAMGAEVPGEVARRAKCVLVFPSVVTGGVLVAGQGGRGYAVCRSGAGWSAAAPISLDGGTAGTQIGAQSTALLALVETDKGKGALMSGDFKVGVDASATAGLASSWRCATGDLLSYSHARGPYAGARLDGATIKADEDSARAIFGANYELKALLGGGVRSPSIPSVQRFLSAAESRFGGVVVGDTRTAGD
jgi:lipid-binding SYLF domain-containing protein